MKERHSHIRSGQSIPQTVEDLLYVMEKDAETMQEMKAEMGQLRAKIARMEQKYDKLRRQKKGTGK